jgi:hypothetical protein
VTRSGDGYPQIIYRMPQSKWRAVVVADLLLIVSTFVVMALPALFEGDIASACLMLLLLGSGPLLGYTAWAYWMVQPLTYTFYPDRLVVERPLFRCVRRFDYPRAAIDVVRQVKDDSDEEDDPHTWGVAIKGQVNGKLLSRQPIDKSDWLGPVVARWAGVAFEPSVKR